MYLKIIESLASINKFIQMMWFITSIQEVCYVHGSVHLESMSIIVQQDATIYDLLYFSKLLYMFRMITSPIVRSTCKL